MGSDNVKLDLKGKMRDITGAMAFAYLEGKTHNRPVSDGDVQRYKADMVAGRWKPSHQGIAFDTDGCLSDGQHRLWAIYEAAKEMPEGWSLRLMVTENVPKDSMIAFDGGRIRTMTDVIRIDDPTSGVSTGHIACARSMMGGVSIRMPRTPTRQEVRDYLNAHWEAVVFAVNGFTPKVRGVARAQVMGVVARAWYTVDPDKLMKFCQILTTGKMTEDADELVIKLRDYLTGLSRGVRTAGGWRAAREMTEQQLVYGKTQRVLQAWLRGETITRVFHSGDEVFVLPEEKKPRRVRKAG